MENPPLSRAQLYGYADGASFRGKTPEQVFQEIAGDNVWTSEESVSGIGSSLEQTGELIARLPELFRQFEVKSLLDVPCGDFNWMRHVDLSEIDYTGGDIVEKIALENNRRFGTATVRFAHIDLMRSTLGPADLLLCRDCLVHLSFADIQAVLANLRKSDVRYFMTTTFPEEPSNEDIQTGGWRPLNLQKPPFNFPEPRFLLNEKCTEMNGAFADKSLGIWEVSVL